nr:unnamed protein product [Callosobruchus chinensis]
MLKQSPLIEELCVHDIKPTGGFALELNHVDTNCRAFLAVGTNPINSIVPMCAEALKKVGGFNPTTLFGITSIDTVRANTFVAQCQGVEPECVMVPVIGGHSEETMVPVLSQTKPCADFSNVSLFLFFFTFQTSTSYIITFKRIDVQVLLNPKKIQTNVLRGCGTSIKSC